MVARTNFLWIGDLVSQVVSILVSIAAVMVLLPYFLGANAEFPDFGYFIYFFFGFITLINIGTVVWRWRRTQQRMDEVSTHPEQWLARWRYDSWTWQEYAQSERRRAYGSIAKWSLPILLIGAFVGYVWLQMFGQQIRWPMLTVIGINLAVLLFQVGILPYYRILHTAPEAIITPEGVCIGGNAYFWQKGNARLRSVALVQGQPNTLEFKLRIQNGRNSSTQVVRVPVLSSNETQAQQVIEKLTPSVDSGQWRLG